MGLKRRNVRGINENTPKDVSKISLSDSQKETIKTAIANKKENREIDICTLEENKEDIKGVTTEEVEIVNDMVKTPVEPINELTDTTEEDSNVEKETVEVQEKEVEDSDVKKEDIAKIIEEENNKSEEDKKVICLDTGIVYENSKDAESKTVAKANAITRCCNGNCKRAGKMRWQYYKDYLLEK